MADQLSIFDPPGVSLSRARAMVDDRLEEGVECPCCGQFCKLYKRKLNSGMAAGLVWLTREYLRSGEWINIPETGPRFLLRTGGQFSVLEHWGLIEQQASDDGAKRTSGMWRPTDKGVDFATKKVRVPSHVHLYDNTVRGWSDRSLDVVEALGSKFDYAELMKDGGK